MKTSLFKGGFLFKPIKNSYIKKDKRYYLLNIKSTILSAAF